MKKFKIVLSFMLVAAMVFAFAGCGDDKVDVQDSKSNVSTTQTTSSTTENTTPEIANIIGRWEGVIDGMKLYENPELVNSLFGNSELVDSDTLDMGLTDVEKLQSYGIKYEYPIFADFAADGKVTLGFPDTLFTDLFKNNKEPLHNMLNDMYTEQYGKSFDDMILAQGYTFDKYFDTLLSMFDTVDSLSTTLDYYFDGSTIYINDAIIVEDGKVQEDAGMAKVNVSVSDGFMTVDSMTLPRSLMKDITDEEFDSAQAALDSLLPLELQLS